MLSITAERTPPGDKETWWWNDKMQEVLSITAVRTPPGDKETWWWNDKVQEVIKAKKVAKNVWEASRKQEDRDSYRQANKAAKKAVATANARAMNELYARSWKHRREKERYLG